MSDSPVLTSLSQVRSDLRRELVDVTEEWGCKVWVSELTGAEVDAYRQKMYKIDGSEITLDMENNSLRLLALALRDPSNNRLFTDVEEGVQELGKMPAGGIEVLAKVARRLSGMGEENKRSLVKNSEPGQTGSSTSASLSPSVSLPETLS